MTVTATDAALREMASVRSALRIRWSVRLSVWVLSGAAASFTLFTPIALLLRLPLAPWMALAALPGAVAALVLFCRRNPAPDIAAAALFAEALGGQSGAVELTLAQPCGDAVSRAAQQTVIKARSRPWPPVLSLRLAAASGLLLLLAAVAGVLLSAYGGIEQAAHPLPADTRRTGNAEPRTATERASAREQVLSELRDWLLAGDPGARQEAAQRWAAMWDQRQSAVEQALASAASAKAAAQSQSNDARAREDAAHALNQAASALAASGVNIDDLRADGAGSAAASPDVLLTSAAKLEALARRNLDAAAIAREMKAHALFDPDGVLREAANSGVRSGTGKRDAGTASAASGGTISIAPDVWKAGEIASPDAHRVDKRVVTALERYRAALASDKGPEDNR